VSAGFLEAAFGLKLGNIGIKVLETFILIVLAGLVSSNSQKIFQLLFHGWIVGNLKKKFGLIIRHLSPQNLPSICLVKRLSSIYLNVLRNTLKIVIMAHFSSSIANNVSLLWQEAILEEFEECRIGFLLCQIARSTKDYLS
jgi:hypothetical protein